MSTAPYRFDFEEIKRTVKMDQIIRHLGLSALKQKSARQWKGACPFCKNPDCFVITNDGGRDKMGAFNCFRCPAGGDQIELVSMMRGNPRKDPQGVFAAAKELHEAFLGGAVGAEQLSANRSDNYPQPQRERKTGFNSEAYLKGLDPAHEALAGIALDPETLREWKAGYASSGVHRGRLALPIIGSDGAIIGFFGRSLKDETPMLTFPNGLDPSTHIFGADRVKPGHLTLLRDPLAVLRAAESGCENVVAFLTEEITTLQLEGLAALMDQRKCESMSFF